MKLSGEAFQAYGTSASNISTYEELRDFLQARFGCRITAQIRRTELFNMKQKSDETLVDYASRIKFVAGEGYPDSSNRQRSELEIAAFLQGCRDKTLAERVMQNSHDDLDSALNAMVRVVQNALMFKSHDPKQAKAVRFLRPVDDHSHKPSAQIDTDDEFQDFELHIHLLDSFFILSYLTRVCNHCSFVLAHPCPCSHSLCHCHPYYYLQLFVHSSSLVQPFPSQCMLSASVVSSPAFVCHHRQ